MSGSAFQWRSIKARVTLFTLTIFVISIWSLSFYVSRMLREDMQQLLGKQQLATVTAMAVEADRELTDRLGGLGKIAGMISPTMLANAAALREFLDVRPVLLSEFSGGVVIIDLDGAMMAESSSSAARGITNYLDLDGVAPALKAGKSTIGKPLMDASLQAPVFSMTVPIRNSEGSVIGALLGVTDLRKPNFLDQITERYYGASGYYLLVDPEARQIIIGTGKTRILEPLPALDVAPLIDRQVQGIEDTVVTENSLGVEVLASAKSIHVADWVLVAAMSTDEALALIHGMHRYMLQATLLLTLLAGGLTSWMLRRELSPMLSAVKTLAALSDSNQPPLPLPIASRDEIGELIGAFNRLLATLGQREQALEASALRFRNLFEKSSMVMMLIDPSTGEIKDANKAAAAYYGYPLERLIGMFESDINTLPVRQIADERQKAVRDECNNFLFAHRLASGEIRDVEENSTPIESGGQLLLFSIVHDITERKGVMTALELSEAWFRRIFENANTGIATTDSSGRLTSFNEAFRAILGYDAEVLKKMTIADFSHSDDLNQEVDFFDEILAHKREHYRMTKRYFASDGRLLWVDLFVTVIRETQGEEVFFVGIITDITARKQDETELRIAATAFESKESMMITDANGVILRVNRAFTESTGYSAEEAVGQTPRLLQSGRHNADFYREIWEAIQRTGGWQGEIWDRRKNGDEYPKWLTISAVKGDDGCVTNFIGTHYDISERKKAEEKIRTLAFFDQLTELPNRTLLLDRLKQAMTASGRNGTYGALLFLDVDDFKTLNDTLGHDVGDLLLKQIAQRLKLCVREGDTVARLGGDEFVVILTGLHTSQDAAAADSETVTEKILDTLRQNYQLGSIAYHCTASIGVTLFTGNLSTIDDLMKQADLAMYKSKAAGRNALSFFDPTMEIAAKKRAALVDDLREALERKQFLLHYQAQVTGEGRLTGVEVLVRWRHPQHGMVSPADFIPLAEETGLIQRLGHWVLETACRQLAIWADRAEMAGLTVSVNVSVHQFRQSDFVDQVLAVLKNTGANPHRLKLELTESLLVHDVEEVIEKMFALKAKGVGFSMDDFGTGYSSLSYLKRLPLDQLKIDQSFVRDVLIDPNDAAIARTIVALAHSLGLGVIAEGVETEAQRDFLASAGCHAYQGYFFSRPLPLDDFEKFAQRDGRKTETGCSDAI